MFKLFWGHLEDIYVRTVTQSVKIIWKFLQDSGDFIRQRLIYLFIRLLLYIRTSSFPYAIYLTSQSPLLLTIIPLFTPSPSSPIPSPSPTHNPLSNPSPNHHPSLYPFSLPLLLPFSLPLLLLLSLPLFSPPTLLFNPPPTHLPTPSPILIPLIAPPPTNHPYL